MHATYKFEATRKGRSAYGADEYAASLHKIAYLSSPWAELSACTHWQSTIKSGLGLVLHLSAAILPGRRRVKDPPKRREVDVYAILLPVYADARFGGYQLALCTKRGTRRTLDVDCTGMKLRYIPRYFQHKPRHKPQLAGANMRVSMYIEVNGRTYQGFVDVANSDIIRGTLAALRSRAARTFAWVKGHNGHESNEQADAAAGAAAAKPQCDNINLTIPTHLRLSGVKVMAASQALAYCAIRAHKLTRFVKRSRTDAMIRKTKAATEETFRLQPLFFLQIAKYGNPRDANLKTCRGEPLFPVDDGTRRLHACDAPGQELIWDSKSCGPNAIKKGSALILACGMAEFTSAKGQLLTGDMRLYQILIADPHTCSGNSVVRG
ncbi:hypothetical protein GLOTRDRAFT_95831 [Gloeophyllum trabeum ATCC 11539]|uniref:RNase H type-1 domain-containing protein n=1 Tax=Gloeophyllum trabeum (strain ATCC 11539 / FP-39264 / Madison 617) TaxID=670483 RepID=S7RD97_GLOTA|nr:uncharacterized protein GLOTRDRAFT_95831 [Gloeophyllum trabeum ATCC 11539]EPQ52185.1 hypothetical protein GLOTRDRAFT_95831 [Gloeophyllum trabeum ATCC 11539]